MIQGSLIVQGRTTNFRSGHRTAQIYRGYAKETMQRALAATRKRHAHLLAHGQLEKTKRHRISEWRAKSISKWARTTAWEQRRFCK
jgi:hypothetical protein